MKRLVPFLLLIPLVCLAQSFTRTAAFNGAAGVRPAVATGDGCGSGNLLFSWHAENVDVTVGTPAGCSVGDTTATPSSLAVITNAQASDGTYSAYYPTDGDQMNFEVSSANIANPTNGTLIFYWRYTGTWVDTYGVWRCNTNTDSWRVYTTGGAYLKMRYGGATDVTSTTALSADTWYKVTVKWNCADVNPNSSIQIDDGTPVTQNVNLTPITGVTNMTFGEFFFGGGTMKYYIDAIKIYDTWLP